MRELDDLKYNCTRRHFLSSTSLGIGALGLASLLDPALLSGETGPEPGDATGPLLKATHFVPRAKRVIYLFQAGPVAARAVRLQAPTQNDERRGAAGVGANGSAADGHDGISTVVPNRRLAVRLPQHGKSGTWVSELLPHTAKIVDELCIVKSMHTEAINHDPAMTFFQTGSQQAGRPSRSVPGFPTGSDRTTRTCRLSSC